MKQRKKNGFIISTTLYGIFGISMLTVFYILYILGTNRTIVDVSTKQVKKEIETVNYQKVYINFLGPKTLLDKITNTTIDNLKSSLNNENIYLVVDKSITNDTAKSVDYTSKSSAEQNMISQKIFSSPSEYQVSCTGTGSAVCQANYNYISGVTTDKKYLFYSIISFPYQHLNREAYCNDNKYNISGAFLNLETGKKNTFSYDNNWCSTYTSKGEIKYKYIWDSQTPSITNFYDAATNNMCVSYGDTNINGYLADKSYHVNINLSTGTSSGIIAGACEKRTEKVETFQDTSKVSFYAANTENKYNNYCYESGDYGYDACINDIPDFDITYHIEKPSRILKYNDQYILQARKGNVPVITSSNVPNKTAFPFLIIQKDIENALISHFYIIWYDNTWYNNNINNISTNDKIRNFNITTTNRDEITNYDLEYYIFTTDEFKDSTGINRYEISDGLKTRLNSNSNIYKILFSTSSNVKNTFPISVDQFYNNNINIDTIKQKILNDVKEIK